MWPVILPVWEDSFSMSFSRVVVNSCCSILLVVFAGFCSWLIHPEWTLCNSGCWVGPWRFSFSLVTSADKMMIKSIMIKIPSTTHIMLIFMVYTTRVLGFCVLAFSSHCCIWCEMKDERKQKSSGNTPHKSITRIRRRFKCARKYPNDQCQRKATGEAVEDHIETTVCISSSYLLILT